MSNNSKLESYLRENSLVRKKRTQTNKIHSLLSLGGKTRKDIDDFYRKSCKIWLEVFIFSKDFYYISEETKDLISCIIKFATIICNNNDPCAVNDHGETFKEVFVKLQPEMLVSDYTIDRYDSEEWVYTDIDMFEMLRSDWENEISKME